MPKVLLVIPSLGYHGSAKQLSLLAAGLPRDQVQVQVCVLGRVGPFGEQLRAAGVIVDALDWVRPVDVVPLLRWRRLVQQLRPDVIHAWGLLALRVVRLMHGSGPCRLGVSGPGLVPKRKRPAALNLLDSRLLRRAAWATFGSTPERVIWEQLGLSDHQIVEVPPGVTIPAEVPGRPRQPAEVPGLPLDARLIVCVGALQPTKGFRDALWALDILKFVYDDVHLVLIGAGPDRDRLEGFAQDIRLSDRIHFLGPQADVTAWLACASIVWVPSLAETGSNVVMEAMALGRPVVASSLPGLAGLVHDGQTGLLVPPGDKPALARQTRLLLEDRELAHRLGVAARRRAADEFAAESMVGRFLRLYHNDPGRISV